MPAFSVFLTAENGSPSSLQSSIHQSVSIIRPGECPYEGGIIKVRPPPRRRTPHIQLPPQTPPSPWAPGSLRTKVVSSLLVMGGPGGLAVRTYVCRSGGGEGLGG